MLVDFWSFILQILKTPFTCYHTKVRMVEGKTYCPNCGCGIIFRWMVLRCSGCGKCRPSRYLFKPGIRLAYLLSLFRQVAPSELCCTSCGETEVKTQYLEDPEFHQLKHAMLIAEAENFDQLMLDRISVYVISMVKVQASFNRIKLPSTT